MTNARPVPCPIVHCSNRVWASRNLPVCGDHATEILHLMDAEVEQRAKSIAKDELRPLKQTVARQQAIINELRAEKPAKAEPKLDGHVYYLRSGAYIKIGWTSDLDTRMRAYSPDSTLLAVEPGTRKDEHRRHKMFSVHRTHGREWYAMVPSLMHHIELIAAEHGQPASVQFAARPVGVPVPRQPETIRQRGGLKVTHRAG